MQKTFNCKQLALKKRAVLFTKNFNFSNKMILSKTKKHNKINQDGFFSTTGNKTRKRVSCPVIG